MASELTDEQLSQFEYMTTNPTISEASKMARELLIARRAFRFDILRFKTAERELIAEGVLDDE